MFVKEMMIRERDFRGEKELIEGASKVSWEVRVPSSWWFTVSKGRCEAMRLRKVVRFGIVNI